jgi:hypothetical protein
MSKTVVIPASTWFELTRQLNAISSAIQVNDLVNREEACKVLGWSSDYFSKKKIAPDSINDFGVKFYSRSKLLGLKKQTA